jgi:hypothetical protein
MTELQPIEEMKLAAKIVENEHYMGDCAGGFPLIAWEKQCRFCGATFEETCKRAADRQSP